MKSFFKCDNLLLPFLLAGGLFLFALLGATGAKADTPNYPVAVPGVQVVPLYIGHTITGTLNPAAKFQLPFPARIVGLTAVAGAIAGTDSTASLTVNLEDDGASILTAALDLGDTAGVMKEATLDGAKSRIADESILEIVLTESGTRTWSQVMVLITLARL